MAGSRLATRILLISRRLSPMANSRRPPAAVISVTIWSVRTLSKNPAPRVIAPWYKDTGEAEKPTPSPKDEAKAIEVNPSMAALAAKLRKYPVMPSCIPPKIAICPTQNSKVADTKPLANKPCDCFPNLLSRASPFLLIRLYV